MNRKPTPAGKNRIRTRYGFRSNPESVITQDIDPVRLSKRADPLCFSIHVCGHCVKVLENPVVSVN